MSTSDRQSTRSTIPRQSTFEGSKSYGSIVSSKSSTNAAKDLYKKSSKMVRPSNCGMPKLVNASSEVRKRVLSARILYRKSYNNKLAEADQIISKLKQENRMLLTIHQRQDAALGKYESSNADLPNLLSSHVDELNSWENKYKKLQAISKELDEKLKDKENIIQELNEQNKRLEQLNKNKNLEDRSRLLEKIRDVEIRLGAKDDELHQAEHLLTFEIQRAKQQLKHEEKKAKEFSGVLEKSRLEATAQEKLKLLSLNKNRLAKTKLPFEKETATTATESTTEDTDAPFPPEYNLSNKKNTKTLNQAVRRSPERKWNVRKIQDKSRIERGDGDAGTTLGELPTKGSTRNFMKLPKKPVQQKRTTKKTVKIQENLPKYESDNLTVSEIDTVNEKGNTNNNNDSIEISSGGTTAVSEKTSDNSNNYVSVTDLCVLGGLGGLGGLGNGLSELHMLAKEYNHASFADNLSELEREVPSNI